MAGIDDLIAEFESKLEAASPEEIQVEEVEALVENDVVEAVGDEEETCIGKSFKILVGLLPPKFVGADELLELLVDLPECEV